jgi:uncharacterized protein YkwD
MMKIRSALHTARALAIAALLATSTLTMPAATYAAPDTDLSVYGTKPQPGQRPQGSKSNGSLAPRSVGSSGPYLDRLLDEINARRAMVGTPPVTYFAPEANAAINGYLADLTPQMVAYNACFHGQNNPVPPSWDYVSAQGIDAEARGEVLACPDSNGYWTSDRIAEAWLHSPTHFQELYADWDANAVACGTYGAQRGGAAFETIACVTYRI